MYMLYYKQLHIVKEPLTKNRTCQTTRNKQVAMCEDRKPLQEYINAQPESQRSRYFIEECPR